MNRKILVLAAAAVLAAFVLSCNKDDDKNNGNGTITMTTSKEGEVNFRLAGSGTITIDWKDGSEIETHTLQEWENQWNKNRFSHNYSNSLTRTITVKGENITHLDCGMISISLTNLDVSNCTKLEYLDCYYNKLTSLDVSKNSKLTYLRCSSNSLSSLDVSKCTALEQLDCNHNQLTGLDVSNSTALIDYGDWHALNVYYNLLDAAALNALFGTLHSKTIDVDRYRKTINIDGNPGRNTCDRSIAVNKGWVVIPNR